MRLFIDGHFLDGRKHGVAIYLDRLYSQYRKLQPDDELHFGIEPGAKSDYELFNMPGVYVHRYRFGGVLRFLCDIPIIARQIDPDVIHTQYVVPLKIGYTARRHVTLYDVLYEDFPELFSPLYRWSRKFVFGFSARRADLITSISEYSRSRIAALYGRPEKEIILVSPGVVDDEKTNAKPVEAARDNTILYVSRFEKRKNHIALLNALVELRQQNPSIQMILVGFDIDGTLARVREFITRYKLNDAVQILSNISDSELENLYRSAGVVAYPSIAEGFGMPVIEAFLLNPSTLFSHSTAMAEFTFAPDNTFDPTDLKEMVQKIGDALCARNKQHAEWQTQRQDVMKKYNWVRSAKILVQFYHAGVIKPTSQSSARIGS
jgi:glycosyltransferase involved in cell wall biosynthesis